MRIAQRLPVSTASPVSLAELSRHMRVEGSQALEMEAAQLAKVAAREIEEYGGLALLPQQITAETDDTPGEILTLPVAPITGALAVEMLDGTSVSTWQIVSERRALIRFTTLPAGPVRVIYTAGFDPLPDDLRHAIMDHAALLFDARGTSEVRQGLSLASARIVARYRRVAL